jgi:hypothetical protein
VPRVFFFQQKFGQDKNRNLKYGQEEELFFHQSIQNLTRFKPKSWMLI